MQKLDTGVLKQLMLSSTNTNHHNHNILVDKPILQVLNIRNISSSNQTNDRYLLLLSDGEYFESACLLLPSLNNLIKYEKLKMFSIIRLDKYALNSIQNGKVLILVDLTVICLESKKIGNPLALVQQNSTSNTTQSISTNKKNKLNLIKLTKKVEIFDDTDEDDEDLTHDCDDECCCDQDEGEDCDGEEDEDEYVEEDEEEYDDGDEDEECVDEDDTNEDIEEICKCNNCQDKNTLKLCYKMLGLNETATKDQVRSKYLSIVTEHKEKVKTGDPKQTEKFDLMTKAFSLIMGIKGNFSDDDNESYEAIENEKVVAVTSSTSLVKGTCGPNGIIYSTLSIHQDKDNLDSNNSVPSSGAQKAKSKVKIPLEDFLSYAYMRAEHEYGKIKIERCYETDSDNSEHSCEIVHGRRKNRNPKAFYQQMKKSNKTLSIKAMKKRAEKVSNLQQHHHHHHHHHVHNKSQNAELLTQHTGENYWRSRRHTVVNEATHHHVNVSASNSNTNSPNGNKISLKINKITANGEGKITCVASTTSSEIKNCDFNSKQFNYIFISDEKTKNQSAQKHTQVPQKEVNKLTPQAKLSQQAQLQPVQPKIDTQLLTIIPTQETNTSKKSKKKKNKKKNKQQKQPQQLEEQHQEYDTLSQVSITRAPSGIDQISKATSSIRIPSDVAVADLAANLENITSEFTREDTQENKILKEKLKNIVNSLQTLQKVIDNKEITTKLSNNPNSSQIAANAKSLEESIREKQEKLNDLNKLLGSAAISKTTSLKATGFKKTNDTLLSELIETKNEITLQLEQHQNSNLSLSESDTVKTLSNLATKTLNNIEQVTKLSEQHKDQLQQQQQSSSKNGKNKNKQKGQPQQQKQTQHQQPQKSTKSSKKSSSGNSKKKDKQVKIQREALKHESSDEEIAKTLNPPLNKTITPKENVQLAVKEPERSEESDTGDWIQVKKSNRNELKQSSSSSSSSNGGSGNQQHTQSLVQKVQSNVKADLIKNKPLIVLNEFESTIRHQQSLNTILLNKPKTLPPKPHSAIEASQTIDEEKKVIEDLIPKSIDEEEIMLKKALELSLKQTQAEEGDKQTKQKPLSSEKQKPKKFDCIDDFTSEIEKAELKSQKTSLRQQPTMPKIKITNQAASTVKVAKVVKQQQQPVIATANVDLTKRHPSITSTSSYVNGMSYAAKSAKSIEDAKILATGTSNPSLIATSNSFSNFSSVDDFPPVSATVTQLKPSLTISTSKSIHQIPIQSVAPIVVDNESHDEVLQENTEQRNEEIHEKEAQNELDPFVKSLSPIIIDPLPQQSSISQEIKPPIEFKVQPSAIVPPITKKQPTITFGHSTKPTCFGDFKDNGVDLPIDSSVSVSASSLISVISGVDSPLKRPIGSERPIGAERPIGYKTNLPTAIVAPSRANVPSVMVPPIKVEPTLAAEPTGLLDDYTFVAGITPSIASNTAKVSSNSLGFNLIKNFQVGQAQSQSLNGAYLNGTNGKVKLVSQQQPQTHQQMMYSHQSMLNSNRLPQYAQQAPYNTSLIQPPQSRLNFYTQQQAQPSLAHNQQAYTATFKQQQYNSSNPFFNGLIHQDQTGLYVHK